MVADAFPITLQLTFIGIFVAVIVATVLGITAALYRDKWQDQVIRVISIACLATPSFWLALLLIQWFSDIPGGTGTFPALVSEWVPFSEDPGTYLNQIFLPALAIAVPNTGSLTRVVRTSKRKETMMGKKNTKSEISPIHTLTTASAPCSPDASMH